MTLIGSFLLVCSHRHQDRSSLYFFSCAANSTSRLSVRKCLRVILRYTVLCWLWVVGVPLPRTTPLPLCSVCVTGIVAQRVCLCVAPLTCSNLWLCQSQYEFCVYTCIPGIVVLSSVYLVSVLCFVCNVVPYCTTSPTPFSSCCQLSVSLLSITPDTDTYGRGCSNLPDWLAYTAIRIWSCVARLPIYVYSSSPETRLTCTIVVRLYCYIQSTAFRFFLCNKVVPGAVWCCCVRLPLGRAVPPLNR